MGVADVADVQGGFAWVEHGGLSKRRLSVDGDGNLVTG